MILKALSPLQSLIPSYRKVKPTRSQIERFKAGLMGLLDGIDENESEEHNKNDLGDFLKATFYQPQFYINTRGRYDLVIHNGQDSRSTPGVIIEVKKPGNRTEMIQPDNLNVKAFHELILYYLRERITNNNLEIRHLIATDVYQWYIFDAAFFEKTFTQDKAFVRQFNDFEAGRLSGNTTDFFYSSIAESFVAGIAQEIEFACFDFRDYDTVLRNADKADDSKLIGLYKVLSPEHLLKLPFLNDSNTLDKGFYTELLHIIGLTEIKSGSKKLIQRRKEGDRDAGSFIENTIVQLDSRDKISRLQRPSQYGETHEEQVFNVALELVITWLNRILFLKLLEAQLIRYHRDDPAFGFLNCSMIEGYDDLDNLFFRVLARKTDERDPDMARLFSKVPYLNSSLFEPTELEHVTIFISNLQDHALLPILSSTVLKDSTGKRRSGNLNGLRYLFGFLDAYDFAGEGSEDIQEENKTLINASVLGLIFEKLNGYKDGSYFTPGFITMYMCRETIRRAVVEKFNEATPGPSPLKKGKYKTLTDVYNAIGIDFDRGQANAIVNSLKICDPAVGSGHFLVSALNEIIAIKSELKILMDKEGRVLRDYEVKVANDELIVTCEDGSLFEYNPGNNESRRVQETLFHEKQTIIENCLFGVDINPNSVKICRLRLWIELLKSAYYLTPRPPLLNGEGELETLPNIDINIKCGNSLISRYALDADIRQALKKSRWNIDSYRAAIMTYRNATGKEEKRAMEQLIASIKNDFEMEVAANDKRVILLKKLNGELYNLTNQTSLFDMTKKEKDEWTRKVKDLTIRIQKLETELEEIKNNRIYENAFEWRFEFPEVLNDDGDFTGFDVVIGNPPYGVSIEDKEREVLISDIGKVPDFEIYYWFINKANLLLKSHGQLSYIIPNSLIFNVFAQNYRLCIFDNWHFNEVLDCSEFNIFSDATVRNIIIMLRKDKNGKEIPYRNTYNVKNFQELINNPQLVVNKEVITKNNQNWGLLFKLNNDIISSISKIRRFKPLSDYFDVSQGYIPYRTSDLIVKYGEEQGKKITKERLWHSNKRPNTEYKQELFGRNITKYSYIKTESYVWYGKHVACYVDPKFFNSKRLLVREITNPTIIACLIEEELVNDPQLISIINKLYINIDLEYLWAILNSRLATFYHFNSSPKATKGVFPKILIYDINHFPIPVNINKNIEKQINKLVNEIMLVKKRNILTDTINIENQIDSLVYELYGLTEEEIKIIEESVR